MSWVFMGNLVLQAACLLLGARLLRRCGVPWGLFLVTILGREVFVFYRRLFEFAVYEAAHDKIPEDLFVHAAAASTMVSLWFVVICWTFKRAVERMELEPSGMQNLKQVAEKTFGRLTRRQRKVVDRIEAAVKRLDDVA